MHPAERHVAKRPFQPSITSYFSRDTDHARDTTHHPRERLAPEVPGQVQADLLSVGMRVRKSVPEGYKTVNKMPVPPTSQHTTRARRSSTSQHISHPREAIPEEALRQRELLPFCGLHKIGGFAEQPTTNPHLYAGRDASGNRATNLFPLPAEAFSQPFLSSQDSGYASDIPPPNPQNPSKRSWQDDDDTPLRATTNFFFNIPKGGEIDDVPVSPLSESPSTNSLPAARPIAHPKSRRPQVLRTGSEDSMDTDSAFDDDMPVEGTIGAGSGSDFEDADFLHDNEVTMGGV